MADDLPSAPPEILRCYRHGTEHVALLNRAENFDALHRKEDLLAEGVHSVFGITGGEAELLALCFPPCQFTPAQARQWLEQWRFQFFDFSEGGIPN